MTFLHIILDSPAIYEITKTELDIGVITQPYVVIAHCIRAGFCISHALRQWVRITIGFDQLGPYTLTLDPTTIRYLGTDERTILLIILRAQQAQRKTKTNVPYGVTLSDSHTLEVMADILQANGQLLIPGECATWQDVYADTEPLVMYCPLFEDWNRKTIMEYRPRFYKSHVSYDLAILEVVYTLDSSNLVMQKD